MCNKSNSRNGECCCECIHYIELKKHPWNKLAKGSINETFGWACIAVHTSVLYLEDTGI